MYSWGAQSTIKKCDIQQNILFEHPGWEKLENLKKNKHFLSFQGFSASSQALAGVSNAF